MASKRPVNSLAEEISADVPKSSPSGPAELHQAAPPLCTGCGFSSAWRQGEGTVSLSKPDKMAPRLALRDERRGEWVKCLHDQCVKTGWKKSTFVYFVLCK
ncbi:hypothetical protein AMECASPLE_030275 [Ameca splendens]|uniref:Uncharacterized protein n=1 Tax=Ameca splendens TaxID=208324 RepID=A0ABV0ZGT8_9TELE